jgi:hypothetical protein
VPQESRCDVEHRRYYGDDLEHLADFEIEDEILAAGRTLALVPLGARPLERDWLAWRYEQLHRLRRCPEWATHALQADDDAVQKVSEETVPAMSAGAPKAHVRVVEVL